MHAQSHTLFSTVLQPQQAKRMRRRVTVRENYPSLFDLRLDESFPWKAIEGEQKSLAIDMLARLMANAAQPQDEEKNDE
jgi:hypothetical protein